MPLPIVEPPEANLLAEFRKGPMAGVDEIIFAVRQPGRPEQCVPISGTPGNRLCPAGRRLVD